MPLTSKGLVNLKYYINDIMSENTESAILPAINSSPTVDDIEMKTEGQNSIWDRSKEKASSCAKSYIIKKSVILILLVMFACTMSYALYITLYALHMYPDNKMEKMSDQPKKLRNISNAFTDLSRKNKDLERRLEKLDTIMARNNEKLAEKLDKLDSITVQNSQKFEGKLDKLDAIMVQSGLEPYLPFGPQSHVSLQLLNAGGWKHCFSLTYDIPLNKKELNKLKTSCTASKIMLACRISNHSTITTLAWGSRDQVLFKTSNPAEYEVENGTGWYYYEETTAVSLQDHGVYRNPDYTTTHPDQLIPVTKGSIGFAAISDDFTLGSGYLPHDLFGYVDQETSNSHKRMSWRILDYPADKISIGHKAMRNEAYRTGGNCGENKHLHTNKWERIGFEM